MQARREGDVSGAELVDERVDLRGDKLELDGRQSPPEPHRRGAILELQTHVGLVVTSAFNHQSYALQVIDLPRGGLRYQPSGSSRLRELEGVHLKSLGFRV